ncbi:MAG TPA: tetratricopeptide repeat protein [Verrucomicrobiae bacterium]|nr:tetratricopeptide repeat protein [Verrucomicrobiae bacterium]
MKFPIARFIAVLAAFAAVLTGIVRLAAYAQSPQNPSSNTYSEQTSKTYDFRFGKGDFSLPGNATTVDNQFIQPSAFPSAEYCGHCHEEAYQQWRQALHSNSFRTPFYRASVNILIRTKGVEFSRHCDSCHNPIAVVSGALTPDSQVDRSFDRDGVTCMTCHSIQGLQSTSGNGGFIMGVPAVMVDENGNRIPGEVPFGDIYEHPERHSAAVMQLFYRSAEFCAACHKANLPNSLNDYKFIRAFTTYDEWQNSKFSHRNPLSFYSADFLTCQNCHMHRVQTTLPDSGAKSGKLASHRWLAGNTAVPFYYGFDEQLQQTIEFLKSGRYLNVDIFALKKAQDDNLIAPLGTVPFELKPNDLVEAYVVVQNKNIGHSLIPEVRDLYQAWVEVAVHDAAGHEIYHSGFLQPDGMLDPRAHSFTNRPVSLSGDFVDNHKVWTIHSMAYDNSIQSGRSALVRYEFRIPANAKGPLSITARVNYRHLRQSYLNNVFGPDHPHYPVIELAARTRELNLGVNQPTAPAAGDNQDWMRWNNVAIGFLDQQQYSDAIDAFQQVVKLRPDYDDGYVNVGLTYLEWEKYAEARAPLETALALHPQYARALYYLALVERREGHPEAEVADLQKMVEQYPQSRDGRRELGIAYYQQHRTDEAIAQFQALQAIDPDDLAAHYNLAILYRRKGMKAEAAAQAALYVTKRIDPGAPTYSLEYLRKHPEISTESVPWHMHTDLKNTNAALNSSGAGNNGQR